MLIAAASALLYLFGGSGSDGLFGELMSNYAENAIEITITDEERRELALEGLTLLISDYNDFNNLISSEIGVLRELINNYQSSPEDFEKNYSDMLTNRQALLDKIWEDRSNMLANITPEEWEKIFDNIKTAAQEN